MNAILQHPAKPGLVTVDERALREAVEQLQTAAEKFSQLQSLLFCAKELKDVQDARRLADLVALAWDTAGIWACHFDSMVIEARQDLMQG